ncbi:MAG: hypothetical protein AAGI44_05875 [Pseudomonadota bacterium]
MVVKTGSIYEQFLMQCLACAVRTLAKQTGRSYAFWVSAIFGQGSAAMRDSFKRRVPETSNEARELNQIKAQMERESVLAQYDDAED